MQTRFPKTIALLCATLFCMTAIGWSDSAAQIQTATPSYAALFKNGVGLIVSKAEIPKPQGKFNLTPFPEATLGSFWINWGDGLSLENIKATQVESHESVTAANIVEMLEANIGNEVELWINDRDKWGRYTILDVPKRHDEPVLRPRVSNVIPIVPPNDRGEIVLLKGDESNEAVPLHWVQAIRAYEEESVKRPRMENVVQFNATPGKSGASTNVSLTYLAKGIAWAPSYVVDISDEDKAVITAKAVIVNDLQPLENTDVELIAGYPNIAHSEANSAFSLTPLEQTLHKIRERGRMRDDLMTGNRPVLEQFSNAIRMDAAPAPSVPSSPIMGESSEDLYFYQIDNVTLKKGERGYYPLFSDKIPYEHVYTWDIPNYINENSNYRGQPDRGSPLQVVWHALKLTNGTGQPWTGAPATTMKDGRILGQDTMFFTAPNAATELKITQAVSINAQQNEYEIERQRSAAQYYGRNYDLVTVRGELAVVNYKDEKVTIEITKNLNGEVTKYDGEPKIVRLANGLNSVNPNSQMVWKVDVKPGKDNDVKLTYTYQIYVRG